MKEEFSDSMIDTELQVRLMNMVMGEASDFERDQLQLLMEQRPELAAYYQHLEHIHGLLCEVGQGELSMEGEASQADEAWLLPADKREQLLAVLDGQVPATAVQVQLGRVAKVIRRTRSRWLIVGAMVVAASLFMMLTLSSAHQLKTLATARRLQARGSEAVLIDNSLSMQKHFADDFVVTEGFATHDQRTRSLAEAGRPTVLNAWEESAPSAAPGNPPGKRYYNQHQSGSSTGADSKSDGVSVGVDGDFAVAMPPAVDSFGYRQAGEPASVRGDTSSTSAPSGPAPQSAADSDRATIMLGGITRFSTDGEIESKDAVESRTKGKQEVALSMEVTPRIHISEEEEPILLGRLPSGQVDAAGKASGDELAVGQELPKLQLADGSADMYQLQSRLDPVGAKEVQVGEVARHDVPAQAQSASQQSAGQQGAGQEAAQAIGAEGPTMPDVQTEYIEDLDLVIIKGAKSDVERTLDAIDARKAVQGLGEKDENVALSTVPPTMPESLKEEMRERMEVMKENMERKQSQKEDAKKGFDASREEAPEFAKLRGRFNANAQWNKSNSGGTPASAGKDQQIASLTESYNELMDEGRFAEAELVAKQVGTLDPDSQIAKLLIENGRMARRDADYEATRELKADNYTDFMSRVDQAFIVPQDSQPLTSNFAEAAPTNTWMFNPTPSPEVASNLFRGIRVEGKPPAAKPTESLDEQNAAVEAFSTFSLHVSDVSFKLAQAALSQSQWPEAAKIRIEEFVNAIDYHDPLPVGHEKVACRIEQAIHPFLMQRNLLRVSMRTVAAGRSQNTPLRLTLVLDNSGSMERADRRQAVLQAIQMLTSRLRPADQVTLISFANSPRLLAEKVTGDQRAQLLKLIETLPSEGGTNIEAALSLAREKALEQKLAGAQNRIVLLTDGAVNLGNANPESLAKHVTELRDAGIAFDAAGISAADLNDEVLEALTRQGDGRYYLLDSADAVSESFAAQIAGALRPSAQNVKVQVEFNPKRVGRYKLLGFEKHRLKQEDFRNDKVDAAEMAAAEAGVAVYHYEIKPGGSGDIGSVSVRFRDLSTGQMVERRWPIPYDTSVPRLEQAEPTMQLAATSALFAAKLSGGPLADSVDLSVLQKVLAGVSEQYASQPRVVQLRTMIEQAMSISVKP